jgi:L-alanine-DL-glutamate epimerase-like enolase superfamily enzyme
MRGIGQPWSRRDFLGKSAQAATIATLGSGGLPSLAAAAVRTRITDVQTMIVKGPRTYTYVKITADNGQFGIAEAYGSPGVAVAEQILALKPLLIGRDPLEVDRIYTTLGSGAASLRGNRTDGSAHMLIRAASGIEMALWDLAGRLLDTPLSILMGGRFRDRVRVYDHSGPKNPWDKRACRSWADKVRAHPSGFTAHKINIMRTLPPYAAPPAGERGGGEEGNGSVMILDNGKDQGNRRMTTLELQRIGQAFENIREAIGWEHDLMVHCHWELDFASAIQLARVLEPIKPMWLEDPLPVDYTDTWKRLMEVSPVPILTGENLARREGFLPFITNQACHYVNPDLRNSGGFLETKRIADMAAPFGISMTSHNTASQLHTYQVCQWAAAVRDYLACETVTGEGGWMDQVLRLDRPYIEQGFVKVSDKPGTGVELNKEVVVAHLAPNQQWWGDA